MEDLSLKLRRPIVGQENIYIYIFFLERGIVDSMTTFNSFFGGLLFKNTQDWYEAYGCQDSPLRFLECIHIKGGLVWFYSTVLGQYLRHQGLLQRRVRDCLFNIQRVLQQLYGTLLCQSVRING